MGMGSVPNKTEEKKTEEKKADTKKKKTASAVKALSEKTGLGKYGEGLLFACMIALFISVCGIIFMFTKAFFHSDSAFYVQLAVEQMKSGKLFPDGMCYSTVLFVRSPNLILIPILAVIKDWMLAREIMVIVMWVMLILAVMYCFLPAKNRNMAAAVIACMLLMNPYQTADVANETTDMLFFQGAYITIFFDIVLALGIMHRIILLDKKDKTAYKAALMALLAVVLFLPLLGSVRQDMILTLPLAAAILIFYFLENDQRVSRVLKCRRCLASVALILVVVVAGFVCYHRLAMMYWRDSKGMYLTMDKYSGLWYSIGQFVNNITMIYGNVEGAVFLSFPGLSKFVNYFVALVVIFIIPTVALIRYNKHKNAFTRFLILYTWVSNLVVIGVFVACNQWAPRYLLSVYLDDILLFAVVFSEYMKKRERLTAVLAGLVIVMYCAFCHVYFWGHYKDKIGTDPSRELISFLQENDLHYGYASFWNASVNTVLSNGDVQVLPLWDHDGKTGSREPYNPSDFRDWLNNRNWYDVESHPGRFIHIVDSFGCGFGNGILAIEAAKLSSQDVDVHEAAALLDAEVPHVCQYFTVDNINHLKRTGRVSGITAAIATVLNIKPILYGDSTGHIISCATVRGRKKSIEALAQKYAEKHAAEENPSVFISHGDCPDDAQMLARLVQAISPNASIRICQHEPFSGAHVGPGMLGLFFRGTSR